MESAGNMLCLGRDAFIYFNHYLVKNCDQTREDYWKYIQDCYGQKLVIAFVIRIGDSFGVRLVATSCLLVVVHPLEDADSIKDGIQVRPFAFFVHFGYFAVFDLRHFSWSWACHQEVQIMVVWLWVYSTNSMVFAL